MRTRVEQPNRVGLLFWIGVIWAVLWGAVIGPIFVSPAYRTLPMEELNQTIWGYTNIGTMLWGFGVPLGAIAAGIGALLYSGAKRATVWTFGVGVLLSIVISTPLQLIGHFPLLFGIGGTLIMLSFFGVLWLWARERRALTGSSARAADLKVVGYVFILVAAWFVCGTASRPFLRAFEGQPPSNPIHIMIFLVLGWVFFFLSHYTSREQQESAGL